MMSLFWYYRPEHTQGGRNPGVHSEVRRHIFFSRKSQFNYFYVLIYMVTKNNECFKKQNKPREILTYAEKHMFEYANPYPL